MGRQPKQFVEYIKSGETSEDTLRKYAQSPATAFLREAVHVSDAMDYCTRHFPQKQDHNYMKDGQDSLYRIAASLLASLMGHFETYQRFLFAGVFEATRLIPNFDVAEACRKLEKEATAVIDLATVSAYRGQPAPIGQLLVDSLQGWQNPVKVNRYFACLVHEHQVYSSSAVKQLKLLWQLRHSTVHTAGWITQPDSQKASELAAFANKPLLFEIHFISTAVRKFHEVVSGAMRGLEAKTRAKLRTDLSDAEKEEINLLFEVTSPRKQWLHWGEKGFGRRTDRLGSRRSSSA